MKTLIIGSSGQLGKEFSYLMEKDDKLSFLMPSSASLDITRKDSLRTYLKIHQPEIVLNFAAYTNVDNSELEPQKAMKVNNLGVKNVVDELNEVQIPLLHISTDYVFGRNGKGPYKILDNHEPINVYGESKYLGEKNILSFSKKAIIIRTASLYSLYGKNFFKTFSEILIENKKIEVVNDQQISITWAYDLAKALVEILTLIKNSKEWRKRQAIDILHLVNTDYTSWYNVAMYIAQYMQQYHVNYANLEVIPISSKDWKVNTPRSEDSRLEFCGKIDQLGQVSMPYWKDSIEKALNLYFKEQ